jgi:hypothetical protein
MKPSKFLHYRRQVELIGGENRRGDLSKNGGGAILLIEEVGSVPCQARNFVSEVDVSGFFEDFDFVFRRNLVQHYLQFIVLQRRSGNSFHLSPDPDDGLRPRRKVQVGCARFVHEIEESIDFRHQYLQRAIVGVL